jgi:cobalamin synthase
MNSDLKFFLIGIIGGLITLFLPVIVWNVWFLDYIDQHGKFWAWVLAPVFALVSAAIFAGAYNARKPLTGKGREGQQLNPFWAWGGIALVVEIFIVALSNS